MEKVIKKFLAVGYGDGCGVGSDNRYDPDYNGGCGFFGGDGSGRGNGSGHGNRNGAGYGNGSGYDSGGTSGEDDGDGYGIKSYNGHEVYIIDNLQTIIYSIRGNIAKGATINEDLTITDCYIAKYEDYFAHGNTAKQAMLDAQAKAYQNKPIEERIDHVVGKYPDVDVPIEHSVLFSLHSFLTGSCLFGRQEFAKSHSLDPEHGTMTMREFISLTKDTFGGDNIRQLADAYKIKL